MRIESLLSARQFFAPQLVGQRLYFISNLSGQMSLYAMDDGGSVPEPLLPPHIALQNPTLLGGQPFIVFPELEQILVMIDHDGDENYQPMVIPTGGGFPELAFGDRLADFRVYCGLEDLEQNIVYLAGEARRESRSHAFRANMATGELTELGSSPFGSSPVGHNEDHSKALLIDFHGFGDHVLYLKEDDQPERRLLYGVPREDRQPDQEVPLNSIGRSFFVANDSALLFTTTLFSDSYGLGYMPLKAQAEIRPVTISGEVHEGVGELERLEHLHDNRYLVAYNIDGSTWLYEGAFDLDSLTMTLEHVICGQDVLSGGVSKGDSYDAQSDRYAISYTTATSPTQIFTVEGPERDVVRCHTNERVLGIPEGYLSPGEDASFTSHDGLRVSARLYLPADGLGYQGPRPLVYYVHGGPQSQEHPDFAWFSMPLIQFLTLQGFAVFVPNVRGSTGYGFDYMKHVQRDWGGADRLDHVHAMTAVLPNDERLDVSQAGVVGRSYGGYMTLTLAARHPELWSAAVDMFGPYDLIGFSQRVPESWKPFFETMIGHPEKDRDFLLERSPRTYLHNLQCPLLVIQGKNDPRVTEEESSELVEELRASGHTVDYLMFPDEGHDVLKFDNRVRCYNAITDFFKQHLMSAEEAAAD
ncbi:MAG: alpha/beta fold hydrolase [Candidatus Promineifilaceae bacterium]|nr:alpha/beta fold hydrolase [Candidatus Promineifilaceae bacterium]